MSYEQLCMYIQYTRKKSPSFCGLAKYNIRPTYFAICDTIYWLLFLILSRDKKETCLPRHWQIHMTHYLNGCKARNLIHKCHINYHIVIWAFIAWHIKWFLIKTITIQVVLAFPNCLALFSHTYMTSSASWYDKINENTCHTIRL